MKSFLILAVFFASYMAQAVTTSVFTDYSVTNLTTTPAVKIASLAQAASYINVFDSSGAILILRVTAPGSVVTDIYLPPGGDAFPFSFQKGSSVSLLTRAGTVSAGQNVLTVN